MRNNTNGRPKPLPKHGLHKSSGQGYVRIPGFKMVYTGKWGTLEAEEKYNQLIAEWLEAKKGIPASWEPVNCYDVNDLLFDYMKWAEDYYVAEDGSQGREMVNLRIALRPLRQRFGLLPAAEFSPLKLKAYRQVMVDEARLKRETINQRVGIVKRLFSWGVEEEKVPASVGHGLGVVRHLRRGRHGLSSQRIIQPAPREDLEAVLPFLVPTHAAMLRVQAWTGMRPGEMVRMRMEDIDRENPKLWIYRPVHHKTERYGIAREIVLGPQCIFCIRRFIQRHATGYLFQPRDAFAEQKARRAEERKTKPTTAQRKKMREVASNPRRKFSDFIQVTNFAEAIRRGCKEAGVPRFTPNQVRHLVATEVREKYGLEATQAVLGHQRISTTQIYAKVSNDHQELVAREMG